MSTRKRKLSLVYVDSEQSNVCSKTAKKGNALNPCASLRVVFKSVNDLPGPCTTHMKRMSHKSNAIQRIERTNSFFHHRVTVGCVSGRSAVTKCPSRKPVHPFAQLLQSERTETEVRVRNDEECSIERYNINAVPKTLTRTFI